MYTYLHMEIFANSTLCKTEDSVEMISNCTVYKYSVL